MTKILNEIRERSALYSPGGDREDAFSVPVPPGEVYDGSRLTILSAWPHAGASILSQSAPGQTGQAEVVVEWQCQRNSMIRYQIEAFSRPEASPAGTAHASTRQMTGFLPGENGYRFDNRFEPTPTYLNTPLGPIKIGDASKGLCGGMVFSALDYFSAGMGTPPDEELPANRELFDYVVKRLLQSFILPAGPLNYIELMHPRYPDGKSTRGRYGFIPAGRAWRMIRVEWPKIKLRLD
ncbi:MAG: hypothetical protein ACK2TX_04660, partial [Anaerolineales bacterium]